MVNKSQQPIDSFKVRAAAKVNLHLEVLGLRTDGFHELAMVMQSIALYDELSFQINSNGVIKLKCNIPSLSIGDDNLIVKAANLLINRLPDEKSHVGIDISLYKNIPIGAGLAGGSADAAATLVALNSLLNLKYTFSELELFAQELGSDVPFCLEGGTQICFGRGEILEPIKLKENKMGIILVKDPSVHISTPWAYNLCKDIRGHNYLSNESDFELRRKKLRESYWLINFGKVNDIPLKNDLQEVVYPVTPAVEKSLNILSTIPDVIASSMSGSGPSCFAIFSDYEIAKSTFSKYRSIFDNEGLNSWVCPFINNGVIIL